MKSIIGHDVQSLNTGHISQGTVTWAKEKRASHHGEGRKEDSVGGVYRILLLSLLILPFMGVYTTKPTRPRPTWAQHYHPPSFLLVLSLSLSLDAGYCWWRGQRMPGGLGDSMSFAYLPCGNGCLSEGRNSQG